MDLLSKEQEASLADLVKRATLLINDGAAPNAAVVKTVKDADLSPALIERICHAVNVGRQLAVFDKQADRLLEFPLVDSRTVLRDLYVNADLPIHIPAEPPVEKAAGMVKAAAAIELTFPVNEFGIPLDHSGLVKESTIAARSLRHTADQRLRQQRCEYQAVEDEFRAKMASVYDYVTRLEPSKLDEMHALVPRFLPAANILLAAFPPPRGDLSKYASRHIVRLSENPFKMLTEALSLLERVKSASSDLAYVQHVCESAEKVAKKVLRVETPQGEGDDLSLNFFPRAVKIADDLGLSIPGVNLAKDSKPSLTNREYLRELDDPRHKAELRGIKALTGLHELVTSDEVLSDYDPDDVVNTYNEVIGLVPEIADKPIVLRGVLRKAMQQGKVLEPFELSQLAGISSERAKVDPENMRDKQVMQSLYGGVTKE